MTDIYECVVCKHGFSNTFDHVFTGVITDRQGGVYADVKDIKHGNHLQAIDNSKPDYTVKCFCGGTFHINSTGEDTYTVDCDRCNFIIDEG